MIIMMKIPTLPVTRPIRMSTNLVTPGTAVVVVVVAEANVAKRELNAKSLANLPNLVVVFISMSFVALRRMFLYQVLSLAQLPQTAIDTKKISCTDFLCIYSDIFFTKNTNRIVSHLLL